MKKIIVLIGACWVIVLLNAENRWVHGFEFKKTIDSLPHEPIDENMHRESFMSQLKKYQGEDADLMDETALRAQLVAYQNKFFDVSTDQSKDQQCELVVDEEKQSYFQQFFMRIIAFFTKK